MQPSKPTSVAATLPAAQVAECSTHQAAHWLASAKQLSGMCPFTDHQGIVWLILAIARVSLNACSASQHQQQGCLQHAASPESASLTTAITAAQVAQAFAGTLCMLCKSASSGLCCKVAGRGQICASTGHNCLASFHALPADACHKGLVPTCLELLFSTIWAVVLVD